MTYTVTIYVAAPGTPLAHNGVGATSLPGHVYYATSYGQHRESYGFAPIEHGKIWGDGKRYSDDETNYQNPRYSRTMEITKEQYDKLNDFGRNAGQHGFNMYYRDASNNCVDFTWGALNYAGLNATIELPRNQHIPLINYEGSLLPSRNIHDIESIQAPFRNSPHNNERWNPMPKLDLIKDPLDAMRWMLSENDKSLEPAKIITKNSSIDDMLDSLYVAAVNKDDKASRAVTHAYLQSDDGQAFIAQGNEFNQQAKAQEQQAAFEAQQALNQQAEMDAPVRRGPVMRMG